jgi:hypothetical protein
MYKVVGHVQQRETLARLVRDGRLPSALIFAGIPSIGKHAIALELTKQLLCHSKLTTAVTNGGCGACQSCALFDAGNHPDLHRLSFGSQEGASVDDLREILERLSLKAFLGGRKVAVFNDADSLSVVGANILLKSLEEPRPDSFFILVLSNPSRLPATLLSRCQRWFFDRLSPHEMKAAIHERGEKDLADTTLLLTEGSFASLDTMRARPGMWEDVCETVKAAFLGEEDKILRAAQEWGGDKGSLKDRLSLLLVCVQQRLTENSSNPAAASVWAHALQNVMDAEYLILDRNVNPVLCLSKVLRSANRSLASDYMNTPLSNRTMLEELGQ